MGVQPLGRTLLAPVVYGCGYTALQELLLLALRSAGQSAVCHCIKLCINSLALHAQAGCCATPTLQAMQATPPASLPLGVDPRLLALVGGLVLLAAAVKKLLDTPSRAYNPDAPNVGDEYDNWTQCAPCCLVLYRSGA